MWQSLISKTVLFLIFIKIGAVSFGGSYSVWSVVQQEFVEQEPTILTEAAQRLPAELFFQFMEAGRMTPGPNINGVLLVGHYYDGFLGMLLVFLGLMIPSAISMIILYHFNRRMGTHAFFGWFKKGAMSGVTGILLFFLYKISSQIPIEHLWQPFAFSIFVGLLFVLIHYQKANVILVTLYSGFVTWAFYWFW